ATPELGGKLSDQIRLCCQAIETAPPGWPNLLGAYALLSQLLVQSGDLTKAQGIINHALEHLLKNATVEEKDFLHLTQGYLWLHSGRFHEAVNLFQSTAVSTSLRKSVAENNEALCWEHLGDFTRARELQLRSLAAAESIGHASGQVLSLINLGAFEFKLGN